MSLNLRYSLTMQCSRPLSLTRYILFYGTMINNFCYDSTFWLLGKGATRDEGQYEGENALCRKDGLEVLQVCRSLLSWRGTTCG